MLTRTFAALFALTLQVQVFCIYSDRRAPLQIAPTLFSKNEFYEGERTTLRCLVRSGDVSWIRISLQGLFFPDFALKYDWNVPGAKVAVNMSLGPLRVEDSGNYTCLVGTPDKSISHSQEIKVHPNPNWKMKPEVIAVPRGGRLETDCQWPKLAAPQEVTWRKEGSPDWSYVIKQINDHMVYVQMPQLTFENNADTGSLVIENIPKRMEGIYECTLTTVEGEDLKKRVEVRVQDPPLIEPFGFQNVVHVGEKAIGLCTVEQGDGPFEFRFLKDGRVLNNSKASVTVGEWSALLTVGPLVREDSGRYTCCVSNLAGEDTSTTQLIVFAPPTWKLQPVNTTAVEGGRLTLECEATGYPPPHIVWRRKDYLRKKRMIEVESVGISSVLRAEKMGSSTSSIKGTLIIDNVQMSAKGVYECVASNGIGPVIRKTATVTIKVPAKFDEKFSVVAVRRGESAKLKCEAQGDQPLSVTWMKDSIKLSKTGGDRFEIFETMTDTGIISEMVIRTTDRVDGAMYKCLAENEYGKDERATKLLIIEVPGSPLNLRMREVWSQSASVTWAAPYSGNSPITQYVIQYWRDSGAPHRLLEKHVPSAQTSTLIGDLSPGTRYALTILAENSVGRGEPARTVTFATGDEEPSAAPTDIVVEARGPSTVRVAWKPPPKDDWNGQLLGYYVGFKAKDSSQPFSHKTVPFANNATQEYFLKNLLKETEYCIVVKAFNSAGSGPSSHEMWVHTLDGDLPAAPVLFVVTTSTTAMTVRWSNKGPDVPITGYTLYYRKEHGPWQEVSLPASADNSYTLRNLDSVGTYQVYVTASNRYGMGDPSEIATVRTEGYVMESPTSAPVCCDLPFLIPVVTAAVAVVIVIVVTCLCVRRIKRRRDPGPVVPFGVLDPDKNITYCSNAHRYVDIEKTRPLMEVEGGSPNHYPSPYATVPMREEGGPGDPVKENLQQEMKSYLAQQGKPRDRPLPIPKPGSLKKIREDGPMYDNPQ